MNTRFKYILWPSCVLGLFVVDRVLKNFYIQNEGTQIEKINSGIAFSLALPPWLIWPLLIAALLYIIFLLSLAIKKKNHTEIFLFSSVLLGALSNLYDRILLGGVIDYIYLSSSLPIFNIADLLIVGGLSLWILIML